MSEVEFKKHRVFRETQDVIFYDISVDESNAADLVVHTGAAISPPDDTVGAKQFYLHEYQDDYNRVVSGQRTFELINFDWKYRYHIVHLNRQSGSIVINQAKRYDGFDASKEFIPRSCAINPDLYAILLTEKPVIHTLGE